MVSGSMMGAEGSINEEVRLEEGPTGVKELVKPMALVLEMRPSSSATMRSSSVMPESLVGELDEVSECVLEGEVSPGALAMPGVEDLLSRDDEEAAAYNIWSSLSATSESRSSMSISSTGGSSAGRHKKPTAPELPTS